MTIADLAPGDQAFVPEWAVARLAIRRTMAAMNMQQPSRRVIAEPVPVPQPVPKRPAPARPVAREVPATARSEPVGSS
jgi:hypothetical protein